ncbi:G-type lectin S-receptor serine/threonine-protein kinase [Salix suchowensis]|nr:G-type lectin S-receptor serine/threonine-protein kinase [Salix suchowensis]
MEAEKLFLFFSLIMLQFSWCTSQDSIKTSQAIKEGDLLISKGNNFALGFFSPGTSSNRYLGIWYHKVNDPIIGSSGFLFVNQYGNLVLYGNDDQKLPVWSTNVSAEENDSCEAQLLDSGNLIMVTKRSRSIIWQSFDHPANTLLPGMKLGLDRKLGIDRLLTSWRSADDPGTGDFSLRINPNGSPQLFFYNGKKAIVRSPPWPWRSQMGLYKSTFVNDQDEIYFLYTIPVFLLQWLHVARICCVWKIFCKIRCFQFWVMLLEIVSGKKNNSFYQQNPPLTLIGYVSYKIAFCALS